MRLCTLNAGLLLVKLLPPVMTEPAAEIEAPLMTADHPDSPLAFGILQHTDEEPLVHALFSMHCHSLWSAAIDAAICQQSSDQHSGTSSCFPAAHPVKAGILPRTEMHQLVGSHLH